LVSGNNLVQTQGYALSTLQEILSLIAVIYQGVIAELQLELVLEVGLPVTLELKKKSTIQFLKFLKILKKMTTNRIQAVNKIFFFY
jgi:hypothetical protein